MAMMHSLSTTAPDHGALPLPQSPIETPVASGDCQALRVAVRSRSTPNPVRASAPAGERHATDAHRQSASTSTWRPPPPIHTPRDLPELLVRCKTGCVGFSAHHLAMNGVAAQASVVSASVIGSPPAGAYRQLG